MNPPRGAEVVKEGGGGIQTFGKSGCSVLEMFVMAHRSEKGGKVGLPGWPEFRHPTASFSKTIFPSADWPITIAKMKALWAVLLVTLLTGMGQGLAMVALSLLLSGLYSSPRFLLLAGGGWGGSETSLRFNSPEQLFYILFRP